MITLTFAGDEAGDVSFAFDKGASRYFVVAMIATSAPDALRQVLMNVRDNAGLDARYEFSFHRLSSAKLRQQILNALAKADFESWALIADKTILPDSFKIMHRLDFYLYFVTEVIQLIPSEKRQDAILILDEFGSVAQVRKELRRLMTIRSIPRQFKKVEVRRSRSESLIQVADLVAGAILRRDTKDDADAFDCLKPRIKKVLEFRG